MITKKFEPAIDSYHQKSFQKDTFATFFQYTVCILLVSLQVLIKPKPVFQTAVVSEQTRQLVTETLQQVTRSADIGQGQTSGQDGSTKDDSGSSAGEASHGSAQGILPFPFTMA